MPHARQRKCRRRSPFGNPRSRQRPDAQPPRLQPLFHRRRSGWELGVRIGRVLPVTRLPRSPLSPTAHSRKFGSHLLRSAPKRSAQDSVPMRHGAACHVGLLRLWPWLSRRTPHRGRRRRAVAANSSQVRLLPQPLASPGTKRRFVWSAALPNPLPPADKKRLSLSRSRRVSGLRSRIAPGPACNIRLRDRHVHPTLATASGTTVSSRSTIC